MATGCRIREQIMSSLGSSRIFTGYQEDRFPADSLKLILDLLTALDHYGFTLVTSLSLTKRVRGRDLWIFTGLQVPDSLHPDYPLTNPYGSNVELKREISPQTGLVSTLPAGAWVAPTGRSPPIPPGPSPLIGNGVTYHTRSVSDTTPMLSSPLKHSAFSFGKATGLLRRTTGKNTIPAAPVPEYPNSISSPEQSPRVAPSSVGSCDMTGVGTGIRQSMMDFQRTPDVFYTADGRQNGTLPQQEHNPFSMAFDSPYPVFPRRTSNESKHHSSSGPLDASRPRGLSESKSSPSPPADVSSRNTPTPQTPSPGRANGEPQQHVHVNEALKSPPTDAPRIPTPPLLASGVFRDSAFTSFTQRQSHEVPITWTGRDPERTDKMIPQMEHERSTSGARNLSQRESDKDDVAHAMFPPTIREQPSQELDELAGAFAMSLNGEPSPDKQKGYVPSMSPKPVHPSGEALRKSEVAALGTLPQHDPKSRPSPPRDRKEKKPARERLDSGWVMVNVEGSEKSKGKGKQSSPDRGRSKSPTSNGRPAPHTRSSSDSKVPSSRSRTPKTTGGNAPATMSAAAKAIVMIDAMDAKHEKAKTRSGFGRLLGRTKGPKDEGGTPSPPRSGTPGKRTPDATLSKSKSLEVEEVKWKKKDVPTTRSRDKRVSID
ncbi:unnamed protein product [Somion occarium]|uniref:Uncharacterized protein n=1 Tax=Somion occarium TaxID=3059160 RepID=A0ABP1CMT6_9APHY